MLECRERSHIKPNHFSLWDFANAVCFANNTDEFTLWPTLAALACCCSRYTVRRSAVWLVSHGWFECIKEATDGKLGAGVYRVVRHKEWVTVRGQKKCIRVKFDEKTGEAIAA